MEATPFDDYLLHPFYLVDDECEAVNQGRVRCRGPALALHDSEVLTIELAGESLGLDTDKGTIRFLRRCPRDEFRALARAHRHLCPAGGRPLRVARRLNERLVGLLMLRAEVSGQPLWLINSLPLHLYQFARAKGRSCSRGPPRTATTTSPVTRSPGSASTCGARTADRSHKSS
jgi:hypothetical protein